jgi:hypothetical protein
VLFIGTPFSNLYTAVDTPAKGSVGVSHSTCHSFEEWVCEVFRCLLPGLLPTPQVTLLRAGWVGSSDNDPSIKEGSSWSLGMFHCAVWQQAGCYSLVLGPLQVCPHNPPLLPLPPVETPSHAVSAPPQAGHKHRCLASPPCPSRPTAAALLTDDPCNSASADGTPPLLPLPPGESLLCAAHAPPQAGHRCRHPVPPPLPRGPRSSPLAPAHARALSQCKWEGSGPPTVESHRERTV